MQQYEIYRGMLEGMAPGPVTVRTFDVDEDQLASRPPRRPLAAAGTAEERGSRQGLRGLRLSLTRPELFRVAAARAAAGGARTARCASCFRSCRASSSCARRGAMVDEAAADLARRGEPVPRVPIGVMIEIPGGGLHRRSAGARSRLLHHRHQRSDSVPPGGRSRRRAGVAAVRAAAPGDPADDRDGAARRGARSGFRCRSAARWPRIRRC